MLKRNVLLGVVAAATIAALFAGLSMNVASGAGTDAPEREWDPQRGTDVRSNRNRHLRRLQARQEARLEKRPSVRAEKKPRATILSRLLASLPPQVGCDARHSWFPD